jgi:E3 ubiquitin-protein ligase TRIP12
MRDCGLSTVLMFLDFFTVNSQRSALEIVANCSKMVHVEMYDSVKEIMPTLENMLTNTDKKSK